MVCGSFPRFDVRSRQEDTARSHSAAVIPNLQNQTPKPALPNTTFHERFSFCLRQRIRNYGGQQRLFVVGIVKHWIRAHFRNAKLAVELYRTAIGGAPVHYVTIDGNVMPRLPTGCLVSARVSEFFKQARHSISLKVLVQITVALLHGAAIC